MSKTETCLYWATLGWQQHDVERETGLLAAAAEEFWDEILRVRRLFSASAEPRALGALHSSR